MIGDFIAKLHAAFYGFGHAIADACDQSEVQPEPRVTVKPHTRKRPYQDRREALHAKLREEIERAA